MKRILLALTLTLLTAAAGAADPAPAKGKNPYLEDGTGTAPGPWFAPMRTPGGQTYFIQKDTPKPARDYEMARILTPAEKKKMMSLAMPMMANMMQLDAREAMNYFALKIKAKPGLSFDEVVESMLLRANKLNFKHVGTNKMWLDFKAVLGDEKGPRIEVYSFCDIAVGRALLKQMPEMIIFLPCRIAVMEDADRNIWILSVDWDVYWLDMAGKAMGINADLREGAIVVKQKMDEIMKAAAAGEL